MSLKEIIEENQGKIDYLDLLNILALVLKKSQASVLANINHQVSALEMRKIKKMIKLRSNNYPLAYLAKEAFFYHLKFKVNENVLIPRPATEKIIDLIMANDLKQEKQSFIDVGCGSGAIIITLADLLVKRPNYSFFGLDISSKALEVARYNAEKYNLNINFKRSNLLSNFQINNDTKIITANLPYLNHQELKEPSIKYEPSLALLAQENGLALYKKLITQLKEYNNLKAYLEILPRQEEEIRRIAKNDFLLSIENDLSQKIKIVILER